MTIDLSRIMQRAIAKERAAYELYEEAAQLAKDAIAKALLEALAREERKHEELLSQASADALIAQKIPRVQDLKVTDFLEDRPLKAGATFQEILIYAAQREKESAQAYEALGLQTSDKATKTLFEQLAAQEWSHKLKLEELYDDVALREN